MAKITFQGNPVNTSGELPAKGSIAKDFKVTKSDLSEATLATYGTKFKVFNIFPSIDTGTCAKSVRRFNEEASKLENTVVVNVSADLPFAQTRFCGSEGLKNVQNVSTFRSTFGKDWGLEFVDSAFKGLLSRAVVVLGPDNKVLHTEQVGEIANEPNYDAALKSFR